MNYCLLIFALLFCLNSGYLKGKVDDHGKPIPVAWWRFDSGDSRKVTDQVSHINDSVQGNYKIVAGVNGQALKLDGFTTVIRRSSEKVPKLSG